MIAKRGNPFMFSLKPSTVNKVVLINFRNCFVPASKQVTENDVQLLQDFIDQTKILTVLTGAGISTESGLPDYRSKDVGLYSRAGYRPMNYSEFLGSHSSRQRYWARSFLGWNYVQSRQPNINHLTLTQWQRFGKLFCCITQNVDRLHHKAGTESVFELHGNLYNVKCINCEYKISRISFQKILAQLNKELLKEDWIQLRLKENRAIRPDGDVDVTDSYLQSFQIPYCNRCNGILKPDIIFFGDNVSQGLVKEIYQQIDYSDSILVIGSSLKVYSSYRFILYAKQHQKQIAILNIGPTRADDIDGIIKIDSKISDVITKIKI